MNIEKLQSLTITFLRFPLIIGVVLIHTEPSDVIIEGVNYGVGNYPLYEYLVRLLTDILSRISVPLYYFIAGFLFFYKIDNFTFKIYKSKLGKRIRTILTPYIIWNLIVILLFFLAQTFLPNFMSGSNKLVCDYSLNDWLWAFWNTNHSFVGGGFPICFQFWFIRDLMLVMLFSPLLYCLIRQLREFVIVVLGILWIFGWWVNLVGLSSTAFFFFSAGAYFSIHKMNFVQIMRKTFPLVVVIYFGIVVCELFFKIDFFSKYIHSLGILLGILSVVTTSSYFIEKGRFKTNEFLASSSFWIYAFHAMPLVLIIKIMLKTLKPQSDIVMVLVYLFSPLITILVGLAVYWVLRRYFPRFTALITGGR